LISVLPKKLSLYNNYNYNPLANICNILTTNKINKDSLDVKITKILNTLRNPKSLFFSYGSQKYSHKVIEKLEELIKIFFQTHFRDLTKYWKTITSLFTSMKNHFRMEMWLSL